MGNIKINPESICTILFQGGTHGNFLRFFIDYFSQLTPEIKGIALDNNGTWHNNIQYSEKINCYHPIEFNNDINFLGKKILITINSSDLLYLERIGLIRIPKTNKTNKDPDFIIRDNYKMSFLNTEKNGYLQNQKIYKKNNIQNLFEFPVSSFWNKKLFFNSIKKIDHELNLKLNLTKESEEIYDNFYKNLQFIETKNRCIDIINCIKNQTNITLKNLDIVEQAYIYAWIENNNNFVTCPLTNSFFNDIDEIIEWISNYPEHYKAMNPNLPTFNNIPNPFYLHNLKK